MASSAALRALALGSVLCMFASCAWSARLDGLAWPHPRLFPSHDVYTEPESGEGFLPEEDELSEHEAKINYIREVFRHAPMTDLLRKHIYENPDPLESPGFSLENIWLELASLMQEDEDVKMELADVIQEYLATRRTVTVEGRARDRSSSSPRQQTEGYEACAMDYNSYIQPVTDGIYRDFVLRFNQFIDDNCLNTPPGCNFLKLPVPDRPEPATWAIRLLDSNAAIPPSGVLPGKMHYVGQEEECLGTTVNYSVNSTGVVEEREFNGYYCRIDFTQTSRNTTIYPLQIGLCFPDTCTQDNITYYLEHDNPVTSFILRLLSRNITAMYCGHELDIYSDPPALAAFSLVLILVIVIIISSCYDGWGRKNYIQRQIRKRIGNPDDIIKNEKRPNHDVRGRLGVRSGKALKELMEQKPSFMDRLEVCWVGFSAYSNLRHLFSTKVRSDHVRTMDGMRSLALIWLIAGMTWVYGIVYFECWTTANLFMAAATYPQEWNFMTVLGVYHCNDLFLVVSGAVCVLAYYRRWEDQGRKMTPWFFFRYFLRRYWALMPPLMLMLFLYATAYMYLGDGPLNPPYIQDAENCKKTWWVALLMLHNIVKTDEQCFAWTWYFAMIFQLNFASFVVLVPLVLVPAVGYFFICAFFVAGLISSAVINVDAVSGDKSWYFDVMQAPWCNATQYAIGMALGVLLHKKKGKANIHPAWVTILWVLALAGVLTVILTPWDKFKENGNTWSDEAQVAYNVLAPILMALSIMWIIFASDVGYGGVFQKLLRWRFFTAFSNLVYGTAVFMGPALMTYAYGRKTLIYIHPNHMVGLFRSYIIRCVMFGLVISLLLLYPLSKGIIKGLSCRNLFEAFRYGRHPKVLDEIGDEDGLREDDGDDGSHKRSPRAPSGLVNVGASFGDLSNGGAKSAASSGKTSSVGGFVPCQETDRYSLNGSKDVRPPDYNNINEYERLSATRSSPEIIMNTEL